MDLHAIKWHKQKNHLLGLYKKISTRKHKNDIFSKCIFLVITYLFLFLYLTKNVITQFTFVEGEIQINNTMHIWMIDWNIRTFCDLLSNQKYYEKIYDMKIKNFIRIQVKWGITYFWDPRHPAKIHLYMLSSASISHQAF